MPGQKKRKQRVLTLADFWQPFMLADVNGRRCREYVAWRTQQPVRSFKRNAPRFVSESAARRELEELRAAINHHRLEGLCSELVSVVLPEKPAGRDVWACRRADPVGSRRTFFGTPLRRGQCRTALTC